MQLPFKLPQPVKAAQISAVPEFADVTPFQRENWAELGQFGPSVLVGYGLDMQRLARKCNSGEVPLQTVDQAIFVLTDCGDRPLSDALRSSFWESFGVPVYELIIAPGCRLLAAECEAHDGWHLQEGSTAYLSKGELICDVPPLKNLHTCLTGSIDSQPCACGRPTTRLKDLAPFSRIATETRLAAIA